MVKICLLNKNTNVCENITLIDNIEDFVPFGDYILAPNQEGEIGWTWTESGWIDPYGIQFTTDRAASRARFKRDALLKKYVDKISPVRWESYTQAQKDAWKEYRQALLDVPQQAEFPANIVWPTEPSDIISPTTVPSAVTPLQIRAAINQEGLREAVDAYVATLNQTEQDAWEYATIIERNNPILVNGATFLGKTEEDIDNLFILASTLI